MAPKQAWREPGQAYAVARDRCSGQNKLASSRHKLGPPQISLRRADGSLLRLDVSLFLPGQACAEPEQACFLSTQACSAPRKLAPSRHKVILAWISLPRPGLAIRRDDVSGLRDGISLCREKGPLWRGGPGGKKAAPANAIRHNRPDPGGGWRPLPPAGDRRRPGHSRRGADHLIARGFRGNEARTRVPGGQGLGSGSTSPTGWQTSMASP